MMKRSTLLAALAATLVAFGASAQTDWPTKPITMVVPYPPGGVNDAVARVYVRQSGTGTVYTFKVLYPDGSEETNGGGTVFCPFGKIKIQFSKSFSSVPKIHLVGGTVGCFGRSSPFRSRTQRLSKRAIIA